MSDDPSLGVETRPPPPAGGPRGRGRSFAHRPDDQSALPDAGGLPPLRGATAWLNAGPLTPGDLHGRVVLVDFWTYTCVNWLRTLPYLRAWHAKYAAAGLTTIGVHTPEFAFEHDLSNVTARTRELGVGYPVAVDNDRRIWDAFANSYWPALYLAGRDGRIRHRHFGEGEYARTEMVIQRLLGDPALPVIDRDLVTVEPHGLEVAADWGSLRSPETYLGYGRSTGFVSEHRRLHDRVHNYEATARPPLNAWSLSGEWTQSRHAVRPAAAGGRIAFAFHARDVNLIMGPAVPGRAVPFRVSLGGRPPGPAHGVDVDPEGRGITDQQNIYQLIRRPGPVEDDLVEIEFLEPGVEAFCFTFG